MDSEVQLQGTEQEKEEFFLAWENLPRILDETIASGPSPEIDAYIQLMVELTGKVCGDGSIETASGFRIEPYFERGILKRNCDRSAVTAIKWFIDCLHSVKLGDSFSSVWEENPPRFHFSTIAVTDADAVIASGKTESRCEHCNKLIWPGRYLKSLCSKCEFRQDNILAQQEAQQAARAKVYSANPAINEYFHLNQQIGELLVFPQLPPEQVEMELQIACLALQNLLPQIQVEAVAVGVDVKFLIKFSRDFYRISRSDQFEESLEEVTCLVTEINLLQPKIPPSKSEIETDSEAESDEELANENEIASMKKRDRLTYLSFLLGKTLAHKRGEIISSPKAVHTWLLDNEWEVEKGELKGYEPHPYDTWSSYLRSAKRHIRTERKRVREQGISPE